MLNILASACSARFHCRSAVHRVGGDPCKRIRSSADIVVSSFIWAMKSITYEECVESRSPGKASYSTRCQWVEQRRPIKVRDGNESVGGVGCTCSSRTSRSASLELLSTSPPQNRACGMLSSDILDCSHPPSNCTPKLVGLILPQLPFSLHRTSYMITHRSKKLASAEKQVKKRWYLCS